MRTPATRAAPAAELSAQIPANQTEKQGVNPLRLPRIPNREASQVTTGPASVRSRNA